MSQAHSELFLHLVWSTTHRAPLLPPEVQAPLWRYLQQKGRELGCAVLAVGGTDNHVHLLVKAPPTLAPAELARRLKGASSRFLSAQTGSEGTTWQAGYGVLSVSKGLVPRVAAYIHQQQEHHHCGTDLPAFEQDLPADLPVAAPG